MKQNNLTKEEINFYVPLDLPEQEITICILKQADAFSEKLIAKNEQNGHGDSYFRDISTSVITNIAIICMLTANIEGRQTDINEIHRCISNFGELKDKVTEIEEAFGTGRDNPYYSMLVYVKKELLGPGAEKMEDYIRGLRYMLDKILMDGYLKNDISVMRSKLSREEMLKRIEEMVNSLPAEKCKDLCHVLIKLMNIWDMASAVKPVFFSKLNDEQIKSIGYNNCPLQCVPCEERCTTMPVEQCRHNLSQAYDIVKI